MPNLFPEGNAFHNLWTEMLTQYGLLITKRAFEFYKEHKAKETIGNPCGFIRKAAQRMHANGYAPAEEYKGQVKAQAPLSRDAATAARMRQRRGAA